MLKFILLSFTILLTSHLHAETNYPNLLFLKEGQTSPKAQLSSVSWLAGHWRGNALGGVVEEVWSSPLGGSMMGAFKLVVGDKVQFYELETIIQKDETLIFRIKHFGHDLVGWEEKDKTVDFALVKVEENKIFFNGLTLERVSGNEMIIYVAIEHGGTVTEEAFPYKRVM
ncbi:hypothetical protein D210916BOD24_29020 [Alteromonas sp. D210916BOD_24]|uniref:DUF6265 family protein n=1 Tax=Alteromonas sp. D210916BOD_24 TaxID=3157618 RepID=UPI00399C94F0